MRVSPRSPAGAYGIQLCVLCAFDFCQTINPFAGEILSHFTGAFEYVYLPRMVRITLGWCGERKLTGIVSCVLPYRGEAIMLGGKHHYLLSCLAILHGILLFVLYI